MRKAMTMELRFVFTYTQEVCLFYIFPTAYVHNIIRRMLMKTTIVALLVVLFRHSRLVGNDLARRCGVLLHLGRLPLR